ncbi:unnamed protein product [Zymoseptoria tritici ST99CH_1A5]|uniref:ASST-domain-containing protein n=1 Tax=Zymoseptoria tritici ST99CH_1A5 TaxID=1276529 RepID=A0A1Y6LMI8_ZYMTR|nr:unnamed protein product [Zymoseptoria tritici ST99CH_1A5]
MLIGCALYSQQVQRPDILAPILHNRVASHDAVEPGYIFFSVWGGVGQWAPYIYDSDLNLVWSGYDPAFSALGHYNFQAHHYANGTQLLSVFRGMSVGGRGRGSVLLLDDSYTITHNIRSSNPAFALDFHEVSIRAESNTAIITAYPTRRMDLSLFDVTESMGWVLDSMFQEIDLNSGSVVFEWTASDHIPLEETTISPALKHGGGLSSHFPFDYCHVNSVDKFANGDYLISSRHTNTIYRISHVDGSILWRLNGDNSSTAETYIPLQDYNFAAQHDARVRRESANGNEIELTLVDNADNGQYYTQDYSSALRVAISFASGRATSRLLQTWLPFEDGQAEHQGTVQYDMPVTGNTLVSWGEIAEFSEFSPSGKRVLDVAFADELLHVYRVMKASWIGRPKTKPDLYMYARSRDEKTQFYMSWNGATEVKEWRCFAIEGDVRANLGVVKREGFETHFEWDGEVDRGMVEALDGDGHVLGTSEVVDLTMPPTHMAAKCGVADCSLQVLQVPKPEEEKEEATMAPDLLVEEPLRAWNMHVLQLVWPLLVGWLFGRFGHQVWPLSYQHSAIVRRRSD